MYQIDFGIHRLAGGAVFPFFRGFSVKQISASVAPDSEKLYILLHSNWNIVWINVGPYSSAGGAVLTLKTVGMKNLCSLFRRFYKEFGQSNQKKSIEKTLCGCSDYMLMPRRFLKF